MDESGSQEMNAERVGPGERVDPAVLERAIALSWDHRTAYQGVSKPGNPALGQCYPTSRVVQWFYPEFEIARGEVWTVHGIERHFWNIRLSDRGEEWIDMSWRQFPPGSVVRQFEMLDRDALGDSEATRERCDLLLRRALKRLASGTAPEGA
jgi:hypothetical protein